MKEEDKHWSSELLIIFGMWLWKNKEYGHALLCIHGPIWGYKIGHQLKITWWDVLDTEDYEIKHAILYPDKYVDHRLIDGVARDYIEMTRDAVEFENWEDSIYMNYRTKKQLSTSTLNRELQKLSEKFLKELEETVDCGLNLKPLKSSAFQIAWALKTVERYHYSKKSFVAVSKFMGHRTLKDTIEILGVKPYDEIYFDFTGATYINSLKVDILDNRSLLQFYTGYAMNI